MLQNRVAQEVAVRRKMSPGAWQIFTENHVAEVVVPNCVQIGEANMVQGLESCCSGQCAPVTTFAHSVVDTSCLHCHSMLQYIAFARRCHVYSSVMCCAHGMSCASILHAKSSMQTIRPSLTNSVDID